MRTFSAVAEVLVVLGLVPCDVQMQNWFKRIPRIRTLMQTSPFILIAQSITA